MTLPAPSCLESSPAGPIVAVMVTAYRIGPVLSDTLLSAMGQRGVTPARVLLVVDGCRDVGTTGRIARRFLAAYPGLFEVLWLENGGVSRARNRGVDWLLSSVPGLEAIYCLDGDDLIAPSALSTGLSTLRAAQAVRSGARIGWVVANKQNFGDDQSYIETPETFLRASYLSVNLSQPSCLYDAAMFRDGLRWDETMRTGIEDWAFWLSAIAAGYEGTFNRRDVLFYRRLYGNRSSQNRRNDSYNIPYMRRRHAALFGVGAILEEQHRRFPRYAFGTPEASVFDCVTDPAIAGQTLPRKTLENALAGRAQRMSPEAYIYDPYFPDLLCLMQPQTRAALQQAGLLRGLLVEAERLIADGMAMVEYCAGVPALEGSIDPDLVIVKPSAICAAGPLRLGDGVLDRRTRRLTLPRGTAPAPISRAGVDALLDALSRAAARGVPLGAAQGTAGQVHVSGRKVAQHGTVTAAAIGTPILLPRVPDPERSAIAIVTPPPSCGGWGHLATALGARPGPAIGLFSPETEVPPVPQVLRDRVEDRVAVGALIDALRPSGGYRMGLPRWETPPAIPAARLVGLLAPFGCVIVHEPARLAGVLLKLRGLGVMRVYCDPDGSLADDGTDPVAAACYAAAFDLFCCRDEVRAAAFRAAGCPAERVKVGYSVPLGATSRDARHA